MTRALRRLSLALSAAALAFGAYFTSPVAARGGGGSSCGFCFNECPSGEYIIAVCNRYCDEGSIDVDCVDGDPSTNGCDPEDPDEEYFVHCLGFGGGPGN